MASDVTYKISIGEIITFGMTKYAEDYRARFIGYNTVKGSRMYKTLNGVPVEKCIETPVCENLMVGMAVGLALEGYRPVVCFERHDFLLLGLDGIVNHIDKLPQMSGDQYKLPILIRCIVGAREPINPGPQHIQDYGIELKSMLKNTPVIYASGPHSVGLSLSRVGETPSGAVVLVEDRDAYKTEVEINDREYGQYNQTILETQKRND